MTSSSQTLPDVGDGSRLYQQLARRLLADLAGGRYAVGDRLPPERELAIEHDVSRPTVREAIIALEVQGLVEVRVGSGAYVVRIPGADRQAAEAPRFSITAFELMEARLAIEGEAAALAMTGNTAGWGVKKGGLWWLSSRSRLSPNECVLRAVIAPDLL